MSMGWENGSRVPTYDPREDEDEDDNFEPVRPEPTALVMVRRLVGFMLADTNPALGVECMALVTSIGYEGDSMADIARRHKCTRAAVSKRCVELCEAFGIHPPRAMRPENNRERCREARVREMMKS
jgi:hypothetical protein